ncbi:acetyl-CoA C-acyltransferase [Parahaliea mediterranea]|uniref:Acetyl-CoA C-acyltransferase n=1 Tax=Parahaliea mediterranea TaxID=651086 RepID=A0A939DDZ3_9GAMM|nr:acetyl-CoA C-acyltransferase [Parahaliea mediterranea]MBN7796423.1 acetyl-CoA C-acyltransferase [Parahaliea mediterranea]
MPEALIVDAVRIPRAKANADTGIYAKCKPVDLLKPLYKALCERNHLDSNNVQDVLLGCSTQSGEQGSNLAKISTLHAGWSDQVSGATINRFCCSGLDAVNIVASKVIAGMESLAVAGGIEHLSRVPMFSDKGPWFSDPEVMKTSRFMHMGVSADLIAVQQGYSKEQLDIVACESHKRAANAIDKGYFDRSLVPVRESNGSPLLLNDNNVRRDFALKTLAKLPPSFTDFVPMAQKLIDKFYPGTALEAVHSAGSSPALVDGASLVMIANQKTCERLGLQPRATVRHFANASCEPVKMLDGHIKATESVLKATGIRTKDIDLWEVNESFASTVLLYQKHFGIDAKRLNVNGGAIALGHPLGATGGILIGTLLDELERRDLKRGVVAICGGAGVGVATLIERT